MFNSRICSGNRLTVPSFRGVLPRSQKPVQHKSRVHFGNQYKEPQKQKQAQQPKPWWETLQDAASNFLQEIEDVLLEPTTTKTTTTTRTEAPQLTKAELLQTLEPFAREATEPLILNEKGLTAFARKLKNLGYGKNMIKFIDAALARTTLSDRENLAALGDMRDVFNSLGASYKEGGSTPENVEAMKLLGNIAHTLKGVYAQKMSSIKLSPRESDRELRKACFAVDEGLASSHPIVFEATKKLYNAVFDENLTDEDFELKREEAQRSRQNHPKYYLGSFDERLNRFLSEKL